MKALQLKKLLEKAGLNQSETARLLDISDRMMRRYVAGHSVIPRVVEYALLHAIELQQKETKR